MKYLPFLFLFIIAACKDKSAEYEQLSILADTGWHKDSLANFEFEITDAKINYMLIYHVRNEVTYPYSNLFMRYHLKDSMGKLIETRLDEMFLADSKTGKPKGRGFGEMRDQQFQFYSAFKFPYSGKYSLSLQQYMRQDILTGIGAVGLRIEKAED